MNARLLPPRIWYERQSCEFESWCQVVDETIRVSIKRDSYDAQSSARAYIWSPVERRWNVMAVVPYPLMSSLTVHAYRPTEGDPDHSGFYEDEAELLEMVEVLLHDPA